MMYANESVMTGLLVWCVIALTATPEDEGLIQSQDKCFCDDQLFCAFMQVIYNMYVFRNV